MQLQCTHIFDAHGPQIVSDDQHIYFRVYHTHQSLADISDEKLKCMDLCQLLLLRGQIEQDIAHYSDAKDADKFPRAYEVALGVDKGCLSMIKEVVELRKLEQTSKNDLTEMTRLKAAFADLTLRVDDLAKAIKKEPQVKAAGNGAPG